MERINISNVASRAKGDINYLRILVIASYARSVLQFRGALLASWLERGHEVHLCCPLKEDCGELLTWANTEGITLHNLPFKRHSIGLFSNLALCMRLVTLVSETRPEAIFSYTLKPVVFGSLIGRVMKVRHIFALVTGRGEVYSRKRGGLSLYVVRPIVTFLYQIAFRSATKVIFQNEDDLAFFKSLGVIQNERGKARVVDGSGVDSVFYGPVAQPQPPVFLFVGRYRVAKGFYDFMKAVDIANQDLGNSGIAIAGWFDGDKEIELENVNDWIKRNEVRDWGFLRDVRDAIANASVIVLPSYGEGVPRSVLEAMSMSRAVITTDAPGCKEVVDDGYNGYCIRVGDVNELARALVKCASNPEKLVEMGMRSRTMILNRFEVRLVNSKISELLDL